MRYKKGFALTELIVVIVIVGVLAIIAIPRFTGAHNRARLETCNTELTMIRKAIALYEIDYGTYPICLSNDWAQLRDKLKDFNGNWYISTLPEVITNDESNNFKDFSYDGDSTTYTIKCCAKDTKSTPFTATPQKVTRGI